MKYKPQRDLAKFAKEFNTLSPSELAQIILEKRNKEITPESITMYFKRHKRLYEKLQQEIIEKELPLLEVQESIFNNGTFEELPSVKNWITEMKRRKIVKYRSNVNALKRCCQGKFSNWGVNLTETDDWAFRHPDRLSLKDALLLIDLLEEKGFDTHTPRLALRNFLESKGIVVGKKISGAKSKSFGKFADLYVEKETLEKILAWIRERSFEIYVIALFMFKTGTRISATLDALIEKIREEGNYREITVYDKARRTKHPEGKPWKKYIPEDLWVALQMLIKNCTEGKIFNVTEREVNNLLREAYKVFIPKLERKITMPSHFWRHMFAQHMLRATEWNYGAVAQLGGWTVKALEESYGKPPRAVVRDWGLAYIPKI